MPEYLSPGVYVEEIDVGPVPIEGVSTSTAGFVGMTAQGPTEGLPRLVTSFGEFQRLFGGYLPESFGNMRFLPYAVQGFFENGGQRVYIKRVVPKTGGPSLATSQNLQGGLITRLSKDVTAGSTQIQLSTMRGIQVDTTPPPPPPGTPPSSTGHPGTTLTFTQLKDGIPTTEAGIAVASYDDSTKTVTLQSALQHSYQARYTTVATDIHDPSTGGKSAVTISAINKGAWGNSLVVQVSHDSIAKSQVKSILAGKLDTVELYSAANFYPGAIVEFNLGKTKIYRKIKDVVGKTIVLTTAFADTNALNKDSSDANFKTIASTCEFRLAVANNGVSETYPILTLDPATPYYVKTQINNQSKLITIEGQDNTSIDPFTMPSTNDGLNVTMAGGADSSGTVTFDAGVYIGDDNGPGKRTGLKALEDIEEISIIAAPGITDQDVVNELIEQCERLKYRFAILDSDYTEKYGGNPQEAVQNYRGQFDTRYAALYIPNVKVRDPLTGRDIAVPPSGHMAGIYARTDIERGVHKAPANEVIRGITDLDLTINKGEQDILNPKNINVLRDFRHQDRGLRVWGARCITSDTQWKYVNVRRLFIFVEASLDRGTQWVVFEPNAEPLWARVSQSISNFLTSVWRDGALMGTKPEEAFFVRVGYSTMTQDDIDNGRLIILVGIAPVKPAEFVIIRISQYTATASTAGQ